MRLRSAAGAAITVLVVAAWWLVLRPVALGGPAEYLIVHGSSMAGTYAPGDLVMTLPRAGYSVGDVVVYANADAQSGQLVVHRVIAVDGDALTTRGDGNDSDDPWQVRQDEVRGAVVGHLPLGTLLAFLRTSHGIAALLALLAVAAVLRLGRRPPARPSAPADAPLGVAILLALALTSTSVVTGWAARIALSATSLSAGVYGCDHPSAPPAEGDTFACDAIG